MINETFVSTQNTAGIETLNSLSPIFYWIAVIGVICVIIMLIEGWLKRK